VITTANGTVHSTKQRSWRCSSTIHQSAIAA
jgi:hypothetical protein